jgi:hypothetical protein
MRILITRLMSLDSTACNAQNKRRVKSVHLIEKEGGVSPKEFKKFKEAVEKIDREYNTPEKAREWLIKIGYLSPDGQVAEKYR